MRNGDDSGASVDADDADDLLLSVAPSQAYLSAIVARGGRQLERTLLRACSSGASDVVEFLLGHGADANAVDEDGATALCLATAHRQGECVRLLVEAGADLEATDRNAGWTALHWATQGSDAPLAFFLLNRGASVAARSRKGLTPIDVASESLREILTAPTHAEPVPVRNDGRKKRLEATFEAARQLDLDIGLLQAEDDATADAEDEDDALDWRNCGMEDVLVFGLNELPSLLDTLISSMQPSRPRRQRGAPAQALFLAARFAAHFGTEEMVEELLLGTMERIELALRDQATDMTVLSHWLYNVLLLLHLLRRDPIVHRATVEELQINLADLAGEIVVFIVRDTERRIDKVLDAAMLDYESLAGLDDVRFEGEWRLSMPKALGGRALFTPGSGSTVTPPLLGSDSPRGSPLRRGTSMTNLRSPPMQIVSPRTITGLLSAVLYVLQAYEIPPAIIVQVFSQCLYWLGCECVNRILTRRRYLCRSKAIQIRLNASSLEDWARVNKLPPRLATAHFAPLSQLVQWLQCLSSEQSIDGLVGTLQSLRALNPGQLRRSARDYRFEVDEPRMADECQAYLEMMQRDWERQRLTHAGVVARSAAREPSADESFAESELGAAVAEHLDAVFGPDGSPALYEPPLPPEPVIGELLDSRIMLPFALPVTNDLLVAHGQTMFGPFASDDPPWPPPAGIDLPDGLLARLDHAASQTHLRASQRGRSGAGLGLDVSTGTPRLPNSSSGL